METTYFVSGYMRCGTSMMMQALEAGGLSAAYDESRNGMNEQFGDDHYKPNEGGFYELRGEEYQQIGFPRMYEGKLIKCLFGGINRIVAGNYKIVFMRRAHEEIRQSYEAFFNKPLPIGKEDVFLQHVENAIGILRQRRDVVLTEVWYREVVKEPLRTFTALAEAGWQIDALKAAAIVDPDLCRFRLETLEVGV